LKTANIRRLKLSSIPGGIFNESFLSSSLIVDGNEISNPTVLFEAETTLMKNEKNGLWTVQKSNKWKNSEKSKKTYGPLPKQTSLSPFGVVFGSLDSKIVEYEATYFSNMHFIAASTFVKLLSDELYLSQDSLSIQNLFLFGLITKNKVLDQFLTTIPSDVFSINSSTRSVTLGGSCVIDDEGLGFVLSYKHP
jgi:hypothetical protein